MTPCYILLSPTRGNCAGLPCMTFVIVNTRVASHLARSDIPSITCIMAGLSCSDTPTYPSDQWQGSTRPLASVRWPAAGFSGEVQFHAFHRSKATLASRCDWVFSCDLIFRPKFFGLPDTQLATLFALPMDNRTTNSFDNRASSSLARSRVIAVLFPLPQNVHGSGFFKKMLLLIAKIRSFWAAWTMMNNCRSQFG